MNISAITNRLSKPYTQCTTIFKSLSKVTYMSYKVPDQDTAQKQKPTVHRFRIGFKKIYQISPQNEIFYNPVKIFTKNPSKTSLVNLYKINKNYNDPVARYPGYPGKKFKSTPPHVVSNWKWYAITKKPTDTGGVKDDLNRLGPHSESYLVPKQKKLHSLEDIKRMLKERSILKKSTDKDRKT